MKRAILLTAIATIMVSLVAGLGANIDASSDDIVLSSSNGYSVDKTFDGSNSDGATKYSWAIEQTRQTGKGLEKTFTFDRTNSRKNTVKLTTSNDSGATKTTTFDQIIHDKPDVTVSASTTSINTGETVDFTSTVDDEIENSTLDYSWTVDGTEEDTSDGFSYTFSNSGTFTVKLTVTDDAGYKGTDSASISVSSNNNNNNNNNGGGDNGGSGGGGGFATISSDDDGDESNATDDSSDEDQDTQSDDTASQAVQKAETRMNSAFNDQVEVTATESSAETSQDVGKISVQALTTTYSTDQGPITEVNVSPNTTGASVNQVRISIPKTDVNTTDAIHGNYTVIEKDPVIETSTTSTIYVEGKADTSTWSFEPTSQQPGNTQQQEEQVEDPEVNTENTNQKSRFTSRQYVYLALGFIIFIGVAIYLTNRTK